MVGRKYIMNFISAVMITKQKTRKITGIATMTGLNGIPMAALNKKKLKIVAQRMKKHLICMIRSTI